MRPHVACYQTSSAATDKCRDVAKQLGNTLWLYQHHGVRKSRRFGLIAPRSYQGRGRLICLQSRVSEDLQPRFRALHGQIGQYQCVLFFVHQSHGLSGGGC